MPGRKGLRGGRGRGGDEEGNREDEKPKSVFATFWANASYKSFAKPHFREAVTDDLEAEGAFPTDRRPGGHHRSAHHGHHPYDSDSNRTPSLSHHHSSSSSTGGGGDGGDGGSHETLTVLPVVANASELERGGGGGGGPPNAPLSPRSLRIPDKRTPSAKFTTHQLLYVFGSHGVGAFIISGGINLAVAYAMYTRTDDPIRLFELPNTLIGDFAVTVIMQTIITWMIEMLVVNRDLRRASVRPIGFVDEPVLNDPSSPSSPLGSWSRRLPRCAVRAARWFFLLDLPKAQRKRRGSCARQLRYVVALVLRALVVAVFWAAVLIGPTVGILIAIGNKQGGDWVYQAGWMPVIYKLILGGVLALLTSPFFAMYWMIKCGWNGGIHESVRISGNETK